jgi:dTDP-4-amino-4,6-dideoxygalactose transaminase
MTPAATAVPLFATRAALEPLLDEVAARQRAVLESGRYILGPEVEAFESELAAFLGVRHCIGVANGTDALTIALRGLGINPGDEVVVPALTFYATAEAVVNAGAAPVFCDVDPRTLTMTAASAEAAIGKRTRALLPVHIFGNPAPVGAQLGGRRAGALGDAATFSFMPAKNLGGFGDGGAVVTDDDEVAAAVRRLRTHGSADRRTHTEVGYNSRLDELQAAGLRVLLPHLGEWTAARRRAAAAYAASGLGDHVELPVETAGGECCYHLYVVRSPRRERLVDALVEAGIGARAYYTIPLHRQPAMAAHAPPSPLPGAEGAAVESLALPMGPALSKTDVAAVATAVAEVTAAG